MAKTLPEIVYVATAIYKKYKLILTRRIAMLLVYKIEKMSTDTFEYWQKLSKWGNKQNTPYKKNFWYN